MYPKLFHIYGPFYIQSYGVCIAFALVIFLLLLNRANKTKKLVTSDQFQTIVFLGIIGAVIGARLMSCIMDGRLNFLEFFQLWYGGFSILGGVMGFLCVVPWYLKKHSIPLLPALDTIALYAPLLQAFSRIGCFMAGCCYGKPTSGWWAIAYWNPDCIAPCGVLLHPAQLYSAGMLGLIFCVLYLLKNKIVQPGYLTALYLFFISCERFTLEYFRQDYIISRFGIISDQQSIALALMVGSLFFMAFRTGKLTTKAV